MFFTAIPLPSWFVNDLYPINNNIFIDFAENIDFSRPIEFAISTIDPLLSKKPGVSQIKIS
jgi:hypothetical protein